MTSTSNKVIIVLAGNYREFVEFARNHADKHRMVFGSDSNSVRGLLAEKVEEIGSFYRRKDAEELMRTAKAQIR